MSVLDLRGLLDALDHANVRFVVVGGVAVGAHGYAPAIRGHRNVTLDTRFGGLDVVQRAAGVPSFHTLDEQAVESELLGVPVRICSLTHLRQMKTASERAQDRADLENLPEA